MGNKKITIVVLVVVALVLALGAKMMFFKNSSIMKQNLISYSYSSGGDMNGSSHSTKIKKYDDSYALVTQSDTNWYFMDPTVREYFVDVKVLDDIKEVVKKYRMYSWDGKKFTDMFIADGASYSYNFTFEEDWISFSSQYYPDSYSKKLDKIDEVINEYMKGAILLPGLVAPQISEEEAWSQWTPSDNKVTLTAYQYAGDYLKFRISNGTDNEITYSVKVTLKNLDTNTVIMSTEEGKDHSDSVQEHASGEESIRLTNRLEAGKYSLQVDGYSCEFEIR